MAAPTTTTVTLNAAPDITRRYKYIDVAVQWTDAGTPTYTTGGQTVSLAAMVNSVKAPRGSFPPGSLPANEDIQQVTEFGGYELQLLKNSSSPTLANYLLKIYSAMGTELSGGSNLPASLFGATVGASPKMVFRIRVKNFN